MEDMNAFDVRIAEIEAKSQVQQAAIAAMLEAFKTAMQRLEAIDTRSEMRWVDSKAERDLDVQLKAMSLEERKLDLEERKRALEEAKLRLAERKLSYESSGGRFTPAVFE